MGKGGEEEPTHFIPADVLARTLGPGGVHASKGDEPAQREELGEQVARKSVLKNRGGGGE